MKTSATLGEKTKTDMQWPSESKSTHVLLTTREAATVTRFLERTAYLRQSYLGTFVSAFSEAYPFTCVQRQPTALWALSASLDIAIRHLIALALLVFANAILLFNAFTGPDTPPTFSLPVDLPGVSIVPGGLTVPVVFSLQGAVALCAALFMRWICDASFLPAKTDSRNAATNGGRPSAIALCARLFLASGLGVAVLWVAMGATDGGFIWTPKRPNTTILATVTALGNTLLCAAALLLWDLLLGPMFVAAVVAPLIRRAALGLPLGLVSLLYRIHPALKAGRTHTSVTDDRRQRDLSTAGSRLSSVHGMKSGIELKSARDVAASRGAMFVDGKLAAKLESIVQASAAGR